MACQAAAIRRRSDSNTFTRMATLLLIAVVFLADVMKVVECRSFQEDYRLQRDRRRTMDDTQDYAADGAAAGEELDDLDAKEETAGSTMPVIMTTGLTSYVTEGVTVNLPCKVAEGSLDEYALLWINGTKTLMTDLYPSSTDPRIKIEPTKTQTGPTERNLIIEQVNRWDSGIYTCRITSTPPVEIKHTLHVTHPISILSVQAKTPQGLLNSESAKKAIVKQGEPVQLICEVSGNPEPRVQWTKKAKYQQQQSTTPTSQDQITVDLPQKLLTTEVVSNMKEVRIESVNLHDIGYYECLAFDGSATANTPEGQNTVAARSGLDLEVEYQPVVSIPRRVVNTGETYNAQLMCSAHSYPKPQISWEKEQITSDGSSSWQPLTNIGPNSRYDVNRQSNQHKTGNFSTEPPIINSILKIKQVLGPQDFGQYRCKANNRQGITYSDGITLTGSPAQPLSTYVKVKSVGSPIFEWTVDSLSPLLEYQFQYKRQQDSSDSWSDVKPQPKVIDTSTNNNAGDERQYILSYTFGSDEQQPNGQQEQSTDGTTTLQPGTTYVARLRARNVHGWSEWSTDVVFSGGMDDDQQTNNIPDHDVRQQNGEKVLISSTVGGSSGASGPQQSCSAATAIVLAAAAVVAVAAVPVY